MCSREKVSGGKLHIPYLHPLPAAAAAPDAGGTPQLRAFQGATARMRGPPCLSRSQKAHRQRGGCFKGFGRERMDVSCTQIKKYNSNKLNFGFRIPHRRKKSQ